MIINTTAKATTLDIKNNKGELIASLSMENVSCSVNMDEVMQESYALGMLFNTLLTQAQGE